MGSVIVEVELDDAGLVFLGDTDPAAWARGRAQALGKALMAIPYYRQSNPVFYRQMRQTLDRVLADPEV